MNKLQQGAAVAAMMLAAGLAAEAKDTSEETRDVGSFDEVYLKGSMDVEVKVGDRQSVRVVADSDIIHHIETEVRGDELHIGLERGNYRNIKKMKVYVTVPKLVAAGVHGSGDLLIENAEADDFELEVHGSGDAILKDGKFKKIEIGLQGSGDIEIDGTCEDIDVELHGSGDVDAEGLKCKSANVSLHGSGDVGVSASDDADVSVQGSGDVIVSGSPDKMRTKVRGSGDVELR